MKGDPRRKHVTNGGRWRSGGGHCHANGGSGKASNNIRLFVAPGMGHRGGGEGPNLFDKVGPLDQWVEQGRPPAAIVASHLTAGKVDRTRPLCPYPQTAKYTGTGSIDDAANFVCAVP